MKDSKAGEDFCCGVVLALFNQVTWCLSGGLEDETDGGECLEEEGRRPWMGAFGKERPIMVTVPCKLRSMPLLEGLHTPYWYIGIVKLLTPFLILVTIRPKS